MIIHGRILSPFTRRVLVWASLQDLAFEQRDIMVMGPEFDTLKAMHPGGRVPVVELSDGARLVDSRAICDWFESIAAPDKRLIPTDPLPRRDVQQRIAHAEAATDRAVLVFYERSRRPENARSEEWADRLIGQCVGDLDWLEAATPAEGFFGGAAPDGSDVAAVALRDFLDVATPDLAARGYPKLTALAARANALPAFAQWRPRPA